MKTIKELEVKVWSEYKEVQLKILKDVLKLIDKRLKHNKDRDALRELILLKARIEG